MSTNISLSDVVIRLKAGECVDDVANKLSKFGVCVIEDVLDKQEVDTLLEGSVERLGDLLRRLLLKQFLDVRNGRGTVPPRYREIVERDGGRFDFRYRMDEEPFRRLVTNTEKENFIWEKVVDKVLGHDAELLFSGVVAALGFDSLNSYEGDSLGFQEWHVDGGHLYREESNISIIHLPPHCVNVFIPLVDVSEANGATQVIPGSHKIADSQVLLEKPLENAISLTAKAGSVIIFDYRLWHRGGENSTELDRHMLYLTFARPWFKDHKNHRAKASILNVDVMGKGDQNNESPPSKKLKIKESSNDAVQVVEGIPLVSTESVYLQSLQWKREGLPNKERFDDDFLYTFETKDKGATPETLTIEQSRTGICSSVWDSSIVLAKYFELYPELICGKKCIGLGSGCGLTEIVAAKLGASLSAMTDIKTALPLLQHNASSHLKDSQYLVHELEWGCALTGIPAPFDVIICADILYIESAIEPLVKTLTALCHQETIAYFGYGRNRCALKTFLTLSARVGFSFELVPKELHHDFFRAADVDILICKLKRKS